jgi:hypothetical protein
MRTNSDTRERLRIPEHISKIVAMRRSIGHAGVAACGCITPDRLVVIKLESKVALASPASENFAVFIRGRAAAGPSFCDMYVRKPRVISA